MGCETWGFHCFSSKPPFEISSFFRWFLPRFQCIIMITILNNGTLGRHDIWSCGDVSGTLSNEKYENVNGKTVDKKNSLYLSRAPVLLPPANIGEQREVNTELHVALADCTYIWKTGASFPYETAFKSKKNLVKYIYVALGCNEACNTKRLVKKKG